MVEGMHHGVSFSQWAFVLAGLGDGLALEELLAHLELDEVRWEAASAAFDEDMLDDVEGYGALTDELDAAMVAARSSWTRAIPPLDEDLRAWLDFYRAFATAEAPMELLDEHGLRPADILRLQGLWNGRLADDAELRARTTEILGEAAGPLPIPRSEPARLLKKKPRAGGADETAAARPRAGAQLPFAEGEPALAHPRLSVPLPLAAKMGKRLGVDETRVARSEGDVAVLPFVAPRSELAPPEVEATRPPSEAPRAAAEEKRGALSVERYAALCADLIDEPDAHEVVLRRYGISAAEKLALDVHWTQQMAEDPGVWLAWDRATAQHRAGLGVGDNARQ
jgi:hypothetical protein